MSERFPWRRVMELGLGQLRLAPRDFWQATPREIAAAFSCETRAPLGRGNLEMLMQRYPDTP